MRWYVPVPPPPELARLLACSWTADPTGTHALVPDGCIDVLWVSTGRLVVCGPETRAWSFALPTGTTAVGVRLRPGVGPRLFGFDASSIVDRRISLCSLIDDDRALLAKLAQATAPADQVAVLESFIATMADRRRVDTSLADAVTDYLVTESRPTVRATARLVGLSERQLHRRAQIDLTPTLRTTRSTATSARRPSLRRSPTSTAPIWSCMRGTSPAPSGWRSTSRSMRTR